MICLSLTSTNHRDNLQQIINHYQPWVDFILLNIGPNYNQEIPQPIIYKHYEDDYGPIMKYYDMRCDSTLIIDDDILLLDIQTLLNCSSDICYGSGFPISEFYNIEGFQRYKLFQSFRHHTGDIIFEAFRGIFFKKSLAINIIPTVSCKESDDLLISTLIHNLQLSTEKKNIGIIQLKEGTKSLHIDNNLLLKYLACYETLND
jgi:hypothetical protein